MFQGPVLSLALQANWHAYHHTMFWVSMIETYWNTVVVGAPSRISDSTLTRRLATYPTFQALNKNQGRGPRLTWLRSDSSRRFIKSQHVKMTILFEDFHGRLVFCSFSMGSAPDIFDICGTGSTPELHSSKSMSQDSRHCSRLRSSVPAM